MKIAVLPGDGIGLEIIAEAKGVLRHLGLPLQFDEAPVGGTAYEKHGDPLQIGGCVLSSLFSASDALLAPTIGLPDDRSCSQHYDGLHRLSCKAAKLHCGDFALPEWHIENFRKRFEKSGC